MNKNIRLFGTSLLTSLLLALAGTTATTSVEAANGGDSPTTIEGFAVDYHLTLGSNSLGSEVGYFTAGKMVEDPPGHKTTGSGPLWEDDGGLEIDPYTYTKTGEKTGEVRLEMADSSVMVRTLTYT